MDCHLLAVPLHPLPQENFPESLITGIMPHKTQDAAAQTRFLAEGFSRKPSLWETFSDECAVLQCCVGGLLRVSCGGIQGVCHTPLQFPQNQSRPYLPGHRENYIRYRKNYIGHRKNYIRHNPNYIRPFFADFKLLKNKNLPSLGLIR